MSVGPLIVHSCGRSATSGGVPAASFQENATFARTGLGIYTITLPTASPLAEADGLFYAEAVDAATEVVAQLVHTTSVIKTVNVTSCAAGAATESNIQWKFERLPGH